MAAPTDALNTATAHAGEGQQQNSGLSSGTGSRGSGTGEAGRQGDICGRSPADLSRAACQRPASAPSNQCPPENRPLPAAFPHLSELQRKYRDKGLRVVGVCMEDDVAASK